MINIGNIPADRVSQACTISPFSFVFVVGFGAFKLGDSRGKLADFIMAPNWTDPRDKPLTNVDPCFTKL